MTVEFCLEKSLRLRSPKVTDSLVRKWLRKLEREDLLRGSQGGVMKMSSRGRLPSLFREGVALTGVTLPGRI